MAMEDETSSSALLPVLRLSGVVGLFGWQTHEDLRRRGEKICVEGREAKGRSERHARMPEIQNDSCDLNAFNDLSQGDWCSASSDALCPKCPTHQKKISQTSELCVRQSIIKTIQTARLIVVGSTSQKVNIPSASLTTAQQQDAAYSKIPPVHFVFGAFGFCHWILARGSTANSAFQKATSFFHSSRKRGCCCPDGFHGQGPRRKDSGHG